SDPSPPSLHDALPISSVVRCNPRRAERRMKVVVAGAQRPPFARDAGEVFLDRALDIVDLVLQPRANAADQRDVMRAIDRVTDARSEEHTSELQSRFDL